LHEAALIPDSIHESSPGRLAELLRRPGDAPEPAWSVDELAEVFRHQLAVPVEEELDRGDAPHGDAPPRAAEPPRPRKSGPRRKTFADLLHRPNPPLDLLRKVKDYAKAARNNPRGPLPAEIATALYFGVIASALVHRGQRLTSLVDQRLFRGLRWMIGQTWLDDATRDLAQQGLNHVEQFNAHPGHQAGEPPHPEHPPAGEVMGD